MNEDMNARGIPVRYVSGLPAVTDITGNRHHNPDAPAGSPSGAGEGFAVAHLTGTTPAILGTADELRAGSVPVVYSPMLGNAVAPGKWRPRAFLPGGRAGSAALLLAGKIARLAARVAVENEFAARYLEESAGIGREKIVVIGVPPPHSPAGGTGGKGGRVERDGNLLVALSDELTPEWNVLRLIFALEKINADAVIVSGASAGDYADSCRERAALNGRVRLLLRGGEGPGAGIDESAAAALERAAVVVDPSTDGLCYPCVASAVAAGLPAVISRHSVCRISKPPGVELFEPSSWELLNHALTTAFNRSSDSGAFRGPAIEPSRAEVATAFGKLYGEIAGGAAA